MKRLSFSITTATMACYGYILMLVLGILTLPDLSNILLVGWYVLVAYVIILNLIDANTNRKKKRSP